MPIKLPPVVGHRGAMGHAPENTVASFAKAAALGVRWVEFDVMLSRDGKAVVIHDEDVRRTTNGTGRIPRMDLDEILGLDAGSWFAGEFAGERIPTLAQTMTVLGDLGLGANVEIKPASGYEKQTGSVVAGMLNDDWPGNLPPPLISSFDVQALSAARATAPDIGRALLVRSISGDWRERLDKLECPAIHAAVGSLTGDLADEVLTAGYALRCFTVNSAEKAAELYAMGVETVFSDYPERMEPVP